MAALLGWWYRIPFACFVHGEELGTASTSRELAFLTRRVLARCEFVVANSRNTLAMLRDEWRLSEARLRLLHPGVDAERFVPAPRNAEVRASLGWRDRPVILTVGRLQLRKGHDTMIRALGRIRQAISEVLFVIAGDGEERPYLESLVRQEQQEGHVLFLGEPDDATLIRCYQQCDLFALPNRAVGKDIEGFGIVLLEAQACGKPVLAGASGGTAETLREGETGRVVKCEEPGPLADAAIALLSRPQGLEGMGRAGREWVVGNFDWGVLAKRAEDLLIS